MAKQETNEAKESQESKICFLGILTTLSRPIGVPLVDPDRASPHSQALVPSLFR
jgi:hypothetical protein